MIEGKVNADYEAVIALALQSQAGQARELEVVIDTGYNGFLSLPPAVIAELEFPLVGPSQATLANGAVETFNVHDATVVWDGRPRDIEVDAVGPVPLAGMQLLGGHELSVQIRTGGRVLIRAEA